MSIDPEKVVSTEGEMVVSIDEDAAGVSIEGEAAVLKTLNGPTAYFADV